MTAAQHNAVVIAPRKICQYSASAWTDGCANAPLGRPQYPALLDGYGANRPPWNVAGVDYHVGAPDGKVLIDWQTLPTSGSPISVNLSNGQIWVSGDFVIDGYDFSTGVGAYLYISGKSYTTTFTITNCKFGAPPGSINASPVFDQNDSTGIISNCTFDQTNRPSDTVISGFSNLTFEYNYIKNATGHIITFANNKGATTGSLVYRFNFIDDMQVPCGTHQNYLQGSNNNQSVGIIVAFNTTIQRTLKGSEGFQLYTNGTRVTYPNPQFTNNTIIARQATPQPLCGNPSLGPQTMTYPVHGSSPNINTGIGQNNNNYFDQSGMLGAYYPGTMSGWASSGNIDMNTGAIITPT